MVYRLSTVRSFAYRQKQCHSTIQKTKTLLWERSSSHTSSTAHHLLMPSGLISTIMTTPSCRTKQTRKELEHYTLAREILQICLQDTVC